MTPRTARRDQLSQYVDWINNRRLHGAIRPGTGFTTREHSKPTTTLKPSQPTRQRHKPPSLYENPALQGPLAQVLDRRGQRRRKPVSRADPIRESAQRMRSGVGHHMRSASSRSTRCYCSAPRCPPDRSSWMFRNTKKSGQEGNFADSRPYQLILVKDQGYIGTG